MGEPASTDGLARVRSLPDQAVVRRVAEIAAEVAPEVPIHLVGGMVRDAWLGRETHDLDLVVAGRGREIAHRLAEALPARFVPLGGKEFAAFRLVAAEAELDLWDREGMTLYQDLARRDLTVNAIALDLGLDRGSLDRDPDRDRLVDPFGGLEDLERRLLRATTETSFSEDPLRVLRIPRFLAEIPGFRVDPATRDLARRAVPGLGRIASERIREELRRLFAGEGAPEAFQELASLAIYPDLFLETGLPPGLETGSEEASESVTEREPVAGEVPGEVPEEVRRIVREMEALPSLEDRLRELAREVGLEREVPVDRATVRWACAVLGQVDPEASLQALQDRGFLSRAHLEPIRTLIQSLNDPDERDDRGGSPDTEDRPVRQGETGTTGQEVHHRLALHRLGDRWADALLLQGAREVFRSPGSREAWERQTREWLTLLREEGAWILDPPRLVTGAEVQERLGLQPGPTIGQVLQAVHRAQVEGRVRTREEALAEVVRLGQEAGDQAPNDARREAGRRRYGKRYR